MLLETPILPLSGGPMAPVDQGNPNTPANAWPIEITDGTDVAEVTAANALKVDGSATTQPVSAAALPLPSGAATSAAQTDGTQKAIVRGGAKGATTAADVTGTAEGADHQALDVQIMHGGAAKDPTQIRALTASDVVTAEQATAASLNATVTQGPAGASAWKVDGSAVTQPVSGTVTAQQATPANLKAEVSQGTAGNLNATVVQGTGSNLHTVLDSGTLTGITNAVAVTAAALPLPSGAATSAAQTDGSQKAICRGGAKGATTAADITGTPSGADHQALDVTLRDGTAGYESVVRGSARYLGVGITQDVEPSASNNSTANLNPNATFTGTGESTLGCNGIQVMFKATQTCTIQVQQSTDNTNWDIVDSYVVPANTGDGRTTQAVGQYVRVLVTNNGGSATTSLRLATYLCPIVECLPRALVSYEGQQYLRVSAVQNVIQSLLNNSTANINGGAAFTGLAETTLGVNSIQVNVFMNQPCTVQVDQSMDGTNWDISDSWTLPASTGDGRTVQATASWFRVVVTNTSGSTATTVRIQTALCPVVEALPRSLGQKVMSKSLTVALASDQSVLPVYDQSGTVYINGTAYTVKHAFANVAASSTDAAIVAAVTSKKIRVLSFRLHAGATATNVTFNTKPAGAGTAISELFACAPNGGRSEARNTDGHFNDTGTGEGLSVTTGAGSTVGVGVNYIEV